MGARTCPLRIIAREPVAELDVRGVGEKSRVEEEDNVWLSGLKIDLRPVDTVRHVGVIRECPTGNGCSWTERARFFSYVGCVDEAFGSGEPEGTVGCSGRSWVGGSAAFAGTHAVPFAKDNSGELGLPAVGNIVQFRDGEPHDATRGAQPKMAVVIFDGSINEKRRNAAACREWCGLLLMYPG